MRMVFLHTGDDFSAKYAAQTYLESLGFAIGSMERDHPIGIHRAPAIISKWTRMTPEEHRALDGFLESGSFRNGDVVLEIKESSLQNVVGDLPVPPGAA